MNPSVRPTDVPNAERHTGDAGRVTAISFESPTDELLAYLGRLRVLAATDIEKAQAYCIKTLELWDPEVLQDERVRKQFIAPGKFKLITAKEYDRIAKGAVGPKKSSREFIPSLLVEAIPDGSDPIVVPTDGNPVIPDGALTVEVLDQDAIANGGTVYIIERIESPTTDRRYGIGVVDYGHGIAFSGSPRKHARRTVVTRGFEGREGNYVPAKVVHEGTIAVMDRPELYRTSADGTLVREEWSDSVMVRAIHKNGDVRFDLIRGQSLRDQTVNAKWTDPLGFAFSEQTKHLASLIRILANECPTGGRIINGMGPVKDDDGSWVYLCDGESYSPDLANPGTLLPVKYTRRQDHIAAELRYYGTTRPSDLNPSKMRKGLELYFREITSCPGNPSVILAQIGNNIASVMGTIDGDFWSVVFQSGTHGSGKTYMCRHFDAIQSPTVRIVGETSPRPFLNLGADGTAKGGPLRLDVTRGYSITSDDVAKEKTDGLPNRLTIRIEKERRVSNIVRSRESGGGAQGGVDRSANKIVSRNSGELQSNARFSSELPLLDSSDRERMIVPPHIDQGFAAGPFDQCARKELDSPENLEALHHAWSALQWFQFGDQGLMRKILDRAQAITATWNVSARTSRRYAACLYGILVLVEYATREDVSAGDAEDYAVSHLRNCAETQAGINVLVTDADLVRQRIRRALSDNRGIAFMGRPLCDENGNHIQSYTNPLPTRTVMLDDDNPVTEPVYPPGISSVEMLGARVKALNADEAQAMAEIGNRTCVGYVVPPTNNSNATVRGFWQLFIPIKDGKLTQLVDAVNDASRRDHDPRQFTAGTFEETLTGETFDGRQVVERTKKRMHTTATGKTLRKVSPQACLVIDFEWLFADSEDDTATDDED